MRFVLIRNHVQCFQDAEELIKAVPGLTDGYYHKVKLPICDKTMQHVMK